MMQRGPKAQLVEFEGVGHAPTLIAPPQVEAVASSCCPTAPMKSHSAEQVEAAAVPELVAAAEQALPQQANALARARAFAEP
jgi:hypothetical protein